MQTRDKIALVALALLVLVIPLVVRMARRKAAPETNAPLPVISEAATDLANYYGGIVEWGHTGAYSNIVSALGKYTDQNPLETDLFKDAAVYASLRDTTDGWIKQGQHDTEKWLAANSQRFATAAVSKPNYVTGYLAIQANEEADLTNLQEAYQNVFSYRLAERDGLTDPALVTDLDRIVLTNSGPELVIPVASKW